MRAQKSDRKIEKKRLEKHHSTIWIILFFFLLLLVFLFADIVRKILGNFSVKYFKRFSQISQGNVSDVTSKSTRHVQRRVV